MWMELIFCLFVTAVLVLVIFILNIDYTEGDNVTKSRWSRLQKLWDGGTFKNKSPIVTKDVIYAMAQRGIYSLNSDNETDEVRLWTHEMLEKSCSKLEQNHENVGSYKKMANDFIENVEKSIEEYEDYLCKLNTDLDVITNTHQIIKKDIEKLRCLVKQQIAGNIKTEVSDNCNRSWVPPVPSIRCPIVADVEDDFLTTLDQFEMARGL